MPGHIQIRAKAYTKCIFQRLTDIRKSPWFLCTLRCPKNSFTSKAYPSSIILSQFGPLSSFQFSEDSSTRTTLFFFNILLIKIQMKRSSRAMVRMAEALSAISFIFGLFQSGDSVYQFNTFYALLFLTFQNRFQTAENLIPTFMRMVIAVLVSELSLGY